MSDDSGEQRADSSDLRVLALVLSLLGIAPSKNALADDPPSNGSKPTQAQPARTDDQPSEVIVVVGRVDASPATLTQSSDRYQFDPLGPATSLSVAERLLTVSGVHARNRSNFAQDLRLSIRGFGARSPFGVRGIKVLLDGIPLTGPDGLAQIDIIDPDSLGSLEVLRGSSGALFGNGSGGVLAFRTAGPTAGRGVSAALRVGDFGFNKQSARVSESFGNAQATFAASRLKVGGYRTHSRTSQRTLSATGAWSLTPRLNVRVAGAFLDAPIGQDPGGLTASERLATPMAAGPNNLRFVTGEAIRQGHLGSQATVVLSPKARLSVEGYLRARSFSGAVPFRFVTVDRREVGGAARLNRPIALGRRRLDLSVAAEVSGLVDSRTNWANRDGKPDGRQTLDQDESVLTGAAFGRARIEMTNWLHLSLGLRLGASRFGLDDRKTDDGDNSDARSIVLPSTFVGISVVPFAHTALFANIGDSFETPTVGELSQRPSTSSVGGFSDELEAQTSRTFEVGGRHSVAKRPSGMQRLEISASVYAIVLKSELIRFEDDTGQSFFRNAGRSRRLGGELELDTAMLNHLEFRFALTSIDAQFTEYSRGEADLSGNAVPGISPHRIGAKVSWNPQQGPFGSIDYDYTRRTFADDENTSRAPGQHIISMRAGMRGRLGRSPVHYEGYIAVNNATGAASVDNLRTNAAGGRFYEPGWPRHAILGIKLGWDFDTPASLD